MVLNIRYFCFQSMVRTYGQKIPTSGCLPQIMKAIEIYIFNFIMSTKYPDGY